MKHLFYSTISVACLFLSVEGQGYTNNNQHSSHQMNKSNDPSIAFHYYDWQNPEDTCDNYLFHDKRTEQFAVFGTLKGFQICDRKAHDGERTLATISVKDTFGKHEEAYTTPYDGPQGIPTPADFDQIKTLIDGNLDNKQNEFSWGTGWDAKKIHIHGRSFGRKTKLLLWNKERLSHLLPLLKAKFEEILKNGYIHSGLRGKKTHVGVKDFAKVHEETRTSRPHYQSHNPGLRAHEGGHH
jgi:hypothetical protein